MNPDVGWRLAHSKLQRMPRLQGMGLLIDHNKQKFVFKVRQDTFAPAAWTALSWFAGPCQLVRISLCLGPLKRRQQLLKLVQRYASRG